VEQNVPRGQTLVLLGSLVAKPVRSRNPSRVAANVQTSREAFYGAFLEYGTSHQPARPWLRPALFQAGPRAIQRALTAVKAAMATDGPLR
jgi:HK97 gp10 family phage protein